MENLWPEIGEIRKTEEVLSFFNELSISLKQNYNGKIQGQLCPIKLVLKNIEEMRTTLLGLSETFKNIDNDKPRYEKIIDVEKDREFVYIKNQDYKYEIFNDHLYYSLFTINIPEFYPIKLTVSAGILAENESEVDIYNLDKLKSVVSEIICSNKVRMVVTKMIL